MKRAEIRSFRESLKGYYEETDGRDERVQKIMRRIPVSAARLMIWMHFAERMPVREVAYHLDVSESCIEKQMNRMLKKIGRENDSDSRRDDFVI